MNFPHPIVTLEEHWLSQAVQDLYVARGAHDPHAPDGIIGYQVPALKEFGETRLKAMDEGGVSLQVVSHAPNSIALDLATCVKVNDEVAARVKAHPERFAGFATLPMIEPLEAAEELRRCVREFGFIGTLIDSNCEGKFYDDERFWPVFAAAEELDVPVYLHPAPNELTKPLLYDGNYPAHIAETLSEFAWGWHNETAIHFLRLFAARLFDRYPRLKLVLGHLGEMLPFQLDRIERITSRGWPLLGVKHERPLRQVWDENVWITTSGMFFMAPMAAVLRQCKPDRIMHSVDYPFGKPTDGTEFLKALKTEGLVDDEMLERIAFKNAEALLKIKARAG